jgi:hypothetical protein
MQKIAKVIDLDSRRCQWNPSVADRTAELYREALEDGDQSRAILCLSALSKSPTPNRHDARAAVLDLLRHEMQRRAGY